MPDHVIGAQVKNHQLGRAHRSVGDELLDEAGVQRPQLAFGVDVYGVDALQREALLGRLHGPRGIRLQVGRRGQEDGPHRESGQGGRHPGLPAGQADVHALLPHLEVADEAILRDELGRVEVLAATVLGGPLEIEHVPFEDQGEVAAGVLRARGASEAVEQQGEEW